MKIAKYEIDRVVKDKMFKLPQLAGLFHFKIKRAISPQATLHASQEIDGSQISDESVPGTRLFILGTSPENRCCFGMEDIAMLLFYLPIIIFEAMLEANINKRKADESTVIK